MSIIKKLNHHFDDLFFHLLSLIPVDYDTEIHEYHKSRGMNVTVKNVEYTT